MASRLSHGLRVGRLRDMVATVTRSNVLRLLDELLHKALIAKRRGHYDVDPLSMLHAEVEKRLEDEIQAELTAEE